MAKRKNPGRQSGKLHEAAISIGHICIEWSRVETTLDEFIELLTPLEEGDVSRSITANLDIRNKVQTVRALAFLRKRSDEWFNKMTLLLDYIDNNLRVRRNRFVHDLWHTPSGRLTKTQRHTKIVRPEAFQLKLITETKTPVKLGEIRKLEAELYDLSFIMFAFWYDHAFPDEQRALPTKWFRRFVRRAKPDAPLTYVNSIRQHPPESSRV